VLVSIMQHGPTPQRMKRLQAALGEPLARRTVLRWREWWRHIFADSPFWAAARARLSSPASQLQLPGSLLKQFRGTAHTKLVALLHFISPVTAPGAFYAL
jgi:hypothetical protein